MKSKIYKHLESGGLWAHLETTKFFDYLGKEYEACVLMSLFDGEKVARTSRDFQREFRCLEVDEVSDCRPRCDKDEAYIKGAEFMGELVKAVSNESRKSYHPEFICTVDGIIEDALRRLKGHE